MKKQEERNRIEKDARAVPQERDEKNDIHPKSGTERIYVL